MTAQLPAVSRKQQADLQALCASELPLAGQQSGLSVARLLCLALVVWPGAPVWLVHEMG